MPPFSSFLTQTSPMPSQQQLSNESFSFGWLTGDEPSSFEAGPPDTVVSRHRSSTSDAYDFDFGLVDSRPLSPFLAHADQIFSNGFLLPLHSAAADHRSKSESTSESGSCSSSTTLSRSLSLDSSESYLSFSNRYNQLLQQYPCNAKTSRPPAPAPLEESFPPPSSSSGRGGASAKNKHLPNYLIARKYLCFLFPWSKKACSRRGSKTTTKKKTSPLTGGGELSSVHLCRDDSYESTAINDAILHCKKSVAST